MKNDNITNMRNSSIEILRVIASFLIVIHHVAEYVPNDFNNRIGDIIIFLFSGHMGNLGNCIFIVLSALYLVDSKKAKPEKAMYLILFETLSACIILGIRIVIGRTIKFSDIKFAISPFLTNQYWWFVNSYIIYYLLHGFINTCIDNISKDMHFKFCFISLLLYTCLPVITHNQLPTSTVTSFIIIHIFISYIKKYDLAKVLSEKKVSVIFGILYFALLFLSYELDAITGTRFFSWRSNVSTTQFYNVILLLFITSLCFYRNKSLWHNKSVNAIASLSLLLFIIHYNPQSIFFVRSKGWNFCNGLLNYNLDRIVHIAIGVLYYIFCVILAFIYKLMFDKTLNRFSKIIVDKIDSFIMSIYKKLSMD